MSDLIPRHRTLRFLTQEQVQRLLRAPLEAKALRDHYLLACAFYLGLRAGETVAMRAPLLRPEHGEAAIPTEKRKPRKADGIDPHTGRPLIPIRLVGGHKVVAAMKEWGKGRLWLFPGANPSARLTTRAAQEVFNRWRVAIGLDSGVTLHSLRHSAGSILYERTKDIVLVKEFLRHTSVATTTQYYLHAMSWEQNRGALD